MPIHLLTTPFWRTLPQYTVKITKTCVAIHNVSHANHEPPVTTRQLSNHPNHRGRGTGNKKRRRRIWRAVDRTLTFCLFAGNVVAHSNAHRRRSPPSSPHWGFLARRFAGKEVFVRIRVVPRRVTRSGCSTPLGHRQHRHAPLPRRSQHLSAPAAGTDGQRTAVVCTATGLWNVAAPLVRPWSKRLHQGKNCSETKVSSSAARARPEDGTLQRSD